MTKNKAIRIVFISYRFIDSYSGAGKMNIKLMEALTQRYGYKCRAISSYFGNRSVHLKDDIKLTLFPMKKTWNTKYSRWKFVIKTINWLISNREKYDIVFVFSGTWIRDIAPMILKILKKPCIFESSLLGSDDLLTIKNTGLLGVLRYHFVSSASIIKVVSKQIKIACLKAGLKESKIKVIYYGIEHNKFRPIILKEKRKLRSQYGLCNERYIGIFVGSIIYRKGVDFLIEMWKYCQENGLKWHLIILGPTNSHENHSVNNDYSEKVYKRVLESKYSDWITFTGKIDDSKEIKNYYNMSDFFLLPSRNEGLPIVLLESMACGLVPLVTDLNGISKEVITDSIDGYILNSKVELFYKKIYNIIHTKGENNKIGRRARDKIKKRFSFDIYCQKHNELFQALIKE